MQNTTQQAAPGPVKNGNRDPINRRRSGSFKQSRRGWLMTYPMLLASLGLHAIVLLGLFFFVRSDPDGTGIYGFGNGDAISATWTRGGGAGDGAGNGNITDTVVPDEEPDGSTDPKSHSVEVQPAKQESPLFDVVQTDPQSVFDANAAEDANSLKDALFKVDANRRSTADALMSTKTVAHPADEEDPVRRKSSSFVSSATDSDPQIASAGNRAGSGLDRVPGLAGDGVGSGRGQGEGGQSNGTGQAIAFFGLRAQARKVVYVIDASESMKRHHAMELARQELWDSLQGLTLTSQFQIVFFNLTNHTIGQSNDRLRLLSATSANLRLAKQFLAGIQPDSGTDRHGAISHALSLEPDVIYLLTDADDPVMSAKDLWEIQRSNKRRVVIHVVEFGIGGDLNRDSFLKKLARENRGLHYYHDLTRASR